MVKEELIQAIQKLNPTARAELLASFSEEDLIAYLSRLQELARSPRRQESPSLALAG